MDVVDGMDGGGQTTTATDNDADSEGQNTDGNNDENGSTQEEEEEEEEQQINKAVTDSNESSTTDSKLSAASATFMALGLASLVTLAFLLMIVIKRRRSESYNEFDNDDDHDLHDKNTDVDAASLTEASSPPNTKRAYVVGEEGSIYTSATHDTRFLHATYESGNDNNDDLQVNVHHCTSALCPICNGRGPIFVNALENIIIDDNGGVGDVHHHHHHPSIELPPYRQNRSYEYELGDEVSVPSFTNPASEMMERPYIVDNTVAF